MEQLQHLWNVAYGARRKAAIWGLFLFTGLLAAHVIFGTNGWMAYEKKKAEYRRVTEQVQQMQQENDRLQQQIKDLKSNPEAIAKQAREQFGYAKPGEVIYVLPAPKQEVTNTAQAKDEPAKK
ncbi:MAG TPA: septum formation initiator family protein [Terriglobales bacterium]